MKIIKYLLAYSVMNLIVSIIYPSIEAFVYAIRGYEAVGGEAFIWLLPIIVLVAYNTYKVGKKVR